MVCELPFSTWELELRTDPNRDYLLEGIEHSFCLIDLDFVSKPVHMKNYASATTTDKLKVEGNIHVEIGQSRYIITDKKHYIVSSIGAVPKPN